MATQSGVFDVLTSVAPLAREAFALAPGLVYVNHAAVGVPAVACVVLISTMRRHPALRSA